MKKIALVNLRYTLDINFERKESLGIAYIASSLMANGHEVDMFDAQYFNMSEEEVLEQLKKKTYDLIGFSLYEETSRQFENIYNMMVDVINPNTHICMGGHFASFTSEELLKRFARLDSIIIGEGERTLVELVDGLSKGTWKNTKGICYLEEGQVVFTEPQQLIAELDSIPYPYRDYYFKDKVSQNQSATISASRGCYANCAFCSIQTFYSKLNGKRIRYREPECVVAEMEHVYKNYGIDYFFFADDNFISSNLVHPGWIEKFAEEIAARKLSIHFDLDCRVNDIEDGIFSLLKKSGLNGVFLGVESFVQRTLDTLNKKVKVEDNLRAIQKLHKLRVNVWMGFIMFDMFTTLDEIRQNIEGFKKIKYFTYFNYDRPISADKVSSKLILYNGTPILKKVMTDYPEILEKNNFGYVYKFIDSKTDRFYQWLLKWKEISIEMIRLDTLWWIRNANSKGMIPLASKLHSLSRKYMAVDLEAFESILDAVDKDCDSDIPSIIEEHKAKFYDIKEKIISIQEQIGK